MIKLVPILLIALVSACAGPSSGPSIGNIHNATLPNSNEKIQVVDLANASFGASTPAAAALQGEGLSRFRTSGFMDGRLRSGDVIDVTILDTGEEGLLSSTESKTLDLGRFTVDQNGFVSLPFAGRQRVIDSTPEGLQRQIVNGLRGSAVNPQAVVTVVEKPTSSVTVNGNVRSAGRFPLTSNKERVLDAIALAGGAVSAPGSTKVTLVRGSQRASVSLDRILAEESQNVRIFPEDQIFVEGNAASFTAMGAFKSTGEFEFQAGKMTLAQALGRAGGLLDDQADARNVYLFRNQPVYNTAVPSEKSGAKAAPVIATKPVIYRVNLRDVVNFARMQQFQMQDGDVLFASNSRFVDAAKIITIFQKNPSLPAAPAPSS